MKMSTHMTSLILPFAIATAMIGATSLRAQEHVRDSEPKLLSYDELVQLSLDQEMMIRWHRERSRCSCWWDFRLWAAC